MAYDIPVAILAVDHQAAAALIGEKPDFFDNERNDRYDGVTRLTQVTNAPVTYWATEDESVYYLGVYVDSDWRIDINAALAAKAAQVRNQHDHPLIKAARLAVVVQFN